MAIGHQNVSVGTTATLLNGVETDSIRGQSLLIQNQSTTASVFIGASNVTTSAYGFELKASTATALTAIAIDLAAGESLYGIVASGTITVNVLRQGV